jgi:two-component system chemotaxis response regulator CheB
VCYVSSNEYSLKVEVNAGNEAVLRIGERVDNPLNYLFTSAANVFRTNTIGVLLTGIGGDGADGFAKIREAGGTTVAQSGHSCVYPNLTEYATAAGVVDMVVDEKQLAPTIHTLIRTRTAKSLVE